MAEDELWRIERALWLEGEDFFGCHVADACVMAFPEPAGMMDRPTAFAGLAGAPRWSTLTLEGQHLVRAGDGGVVVLGYRATAERTGSPLYRALCTSTYVRDGDRWLLVQHQQTPAG